jgi:hypothetical protein
MYSAPEEQVGANDHQVWFIKTNPAEKETILSTASGAVFIRRRISLYPANRNSYKYINRVSICIEYDL